MTLVTLGEACSLLTDGTHYTPSPIPHGIPFLTVKDVTNGALDFDRCARISREDYSAAEAGNSAPRRGDVLFSKDGTVGKVHVVSTDQPFAVLSSLAILRPGPEVDSAYLGHALRAPSVIDQAMRRKTGSAIRRVILSDLKQLTFPLPPIEEQRRIAAILDHAESMSDLHSRQLAVLEDMRVAAVRAAGGAPFQRLGDLARVSSGSTPSRSAKSNFGPGTPWVKTTEVKGDWIRVTEESVTPAGLKAARLKVYAPGSLILAMYGQGATRGRVARLGIGAAVNQACAVIEPGSDVDPDYLFGVLHGSYLQIRNAGRGGTQPNLNLALVRSIEIPVPGLDVQQQVAAQLRHIDSVRNRLLDRAQRLSHLRGSLQARAFSGRL